jgi:hypothetical protein
VGSKLAAASIALEKLEKLEAITESTLKKYGRVPDSLAEALASAEVDYGVAKDNLPLSRRGHNLISCLYFATDICNT